MKKSITVIVGVFVLFLVSFGVMVLVVQNMQDVKEVAEFDKKFELVNIGDLQANVVSVLGKPDEKGHEFRLGQKEGFEDSYARTEASNTEYYLFWFRGIDIVFTVGFNNLGQVSVKESGGT